MGNSAAKREAKALKAQAKETRRQAGIYREQGYAEAGDMTQDANSYLSQQMALLGKVGALGVQSKAIDYSGIESGIDTGSLEGTSVTDLKEGLPDKETKLEKLKTDYAAKQLEQENSDHKKPLIDSDKIAIDKLEKDIKTQKADLTNLTTGLDKIGDVSASETANLTTGSTALNLKTLQDNLLKTRNKYVNQVQEDVYSSIMNAEMLSDQAAAASKAAAMQPFTTLLTAGAGAVIGFATAGAGLGAWGAGAGFMSGLASGLR